MNTTMMIDPPLVWKNGPSLGVMIIGTIQFWCLGQDIICLIAMFNWLSYLRVSLDLFISTVDTLLRCTAIALTHRFSSFSDVSATFSFLMKKSLNSYL